MKPRRFRNLLCVLCLTSASSAGHAQTAPANVRDGCVAGQIPASTPDAYVDLFPVPTGMDFVLTDVRYETGTFGGPCPIVDELGTLRWSLVGTQLGQARDASWTTGVRFGPGRIVRMGFPNVGNPIGYNICWSGYVAPVSTTAVPATDESQLFGLKIGPNPTGSGATISFRLDHGGPVALGIYDASGRLVRRLQSCPMPPGDQQVRWDGSDRKGRSVESGIYFARLETAHGRRTAKIVRTN